MLNIERIWKIMGESSQQQVQVRTEALLAERHYGIENLVLYDYGT